MAFQRIHLRARLLHWLCGKAGDAKYGHCVQYLESVIFLLLGVGFIIASLCSFPGNSEETLILGTWIFLGCGGVNLMLSFHDLHETYHAKNNGVSSEERAEIAESLGFLLSGMLFVAGLILSLVFWNHDEFGWRSWFFVASKIVLIFAVYLNAIGLATEMRRDHLPSEIQGKIFVISCASLFCTMMGGVTFVCASFLCLPEIGDPNSMGSWCFLIGSVFFLVQSLLCTLAIVIAHQTQRQTQRQPDQPDQPSPDPEQTNTA